MVKTNKTVVALLMVILALIFGVVYLVFKGKSNNKLKESKKETVTKKTGEEKPAYYFIAIHNEPYHADGGEKNIESDYKTLAEMVTKADSYNIKLTLMFSPQWSDYIIENGKLDEVKSWAKNGHEIAAHHHSIYHENWDGYTNHAKGEAIEQREKILEGSYKNPESHLGRLDDFMSKVNRLSNDGIASGCVNNRQDGKETPDGIIYDTCSGFATHGKIGEKLDDTSDPQKGVNEYVLTGTINGVKRYWLSHYQVYQAPRKTKDAYNAMPGNQVYGVVLHSFPKQAEILYDFMEFLSKNDPKGEKSKTVSQIVTENLLPVKELSKENIKQGIKETETESGKCGDKVCDDLEKRNARLCPSDCE